jgi:hypothetical protein
VQRDRPQGPNYTQTRHWIGQSWLAKVPKLERERIVEQEHSAEQERIVEQEHSVEQERIVEQEQEHSFEQERIVEQEHIVEQEELHNIPVERPLEPEPLDPQEQVDGRWQEVAIGMELDCTTEEEHCKS